MCNPLTEEQKDHINWLAHRLDWVEKVYFDDQLTNGESVCVSVVTYGHNYFGKEWDEIIKQMEYHVQTQGTPADHRSSEPTQEEAWEEKGI